MSDELCEESAGRLSWLCLVWTAMWGLGVVLNELVAPLLRLPMDRVVPWSHAATLISLLCLVLSLALYLLARRHGRNARLLVDVALGYEVVTAFAIGIVNQTDPMRILAGRLSWICVLVLIFPMIVPNTPRKVLVAGVLAASMDPLAIAIMSARGHPTPPTVLILWAYLPNYVCAVLAVVPSIILMQLSRQASKAREFGSYRLDEMLGRGGMGEVWRARHRLLARPAAVKLIKPEALGAGKDESGRLAIRRFRREAEAAAALQSPHTIRLYDFGETSDGTFYYAMELLDGLDLESLVRRFGPQPYERVVFLLQQACHSLAEAHVGGLIHRDIKPANIFACRMGLEVDFVKVLDFGLVKSDTRHQQEGTLLTAPEVTTGTPAYMAPEMAAGDNPVDQQADIYALGCVGYWLLTGQLVFEAEGALQMIVRHLQAVPVAPSRRTELPVPPALDQVILECLAKNPNQRPAGAAELARRLGVCRDQREWGQERAQQWWQTHLPAQPALASARWSTGKAIEVATG